MPRTKERLALLEHSALWVEIKTPEAKTPGAFSETISRAF